MSLPNCLWLSTDLHTYMKKLQEALGKKLKNKYNNPSGILSPEERKEERTEKNRSTSKVKMKKTTRRHILTKLLKPGDKEKKI